MLRSAERDFRAMLLCRSTPDRDSVSGQKLRWSRHVIIQWCRWGRFNLGA